MGGYADGGLGLIPTYAGNTKATAVMDSARGAHPHVCGEHENEILAHIVSKGSSPRMRGTR